MRMDLGTRNTLLYDFMHCMTAVSLEMSDEPLKEHVLVLNCVKIVYNTTNKQMSCS